MRKRSNLWRDVSARVVCWSLMRRVWVGAIVVGLPCAICPASVSAATIDFGSVANVDFTPGETYTEDGFTLSVLSGANWGIFFATGNPGSGLIAGTFDRIAVGDVLSITRNGGGFFTFESFDFGAPGQSTTDGVDFVGSVNGVQTEILANVFTGMNYRTGNPMFGGSINELRIVGASQMDTGLMLDNFVLTPVESSAVPEPASLTLLGLGLASAGARRWRRRTLL